MTTVPTAEDLCLASDREIRAAYDEITAFRNTYSRSQLVRNRIDCIQAELQEALDESEQSREEGNEGT